MKRAVRKLKTWPKFMKRGGRKPGAHHHHYHETEQSSGCSACSAWQPQPSAPPLPPPEELEHLHNASNAAATLHHPPPIVASRSPSDVTILLCVPVNVSIATAAASTGSYQQYLAPSPVLGVPFQPAAAPRGGNSNLVACFTDFAAFLNQCLCSCFQYRS